MDAAGVSDFVVVLLSVLVEAAGAAGVVATGVVDAFSAAFSAFSVLSGVLLSVTYHPEPLNTMPTG